MTQSDNLVNLLWEVNENYIVFKYNDSLIAALSEGIIGQPNSIQIKSKNFNFWFWSRLFLGQCDYKFKQTKI